jgi:ABC-type sugar transport system, periplasmic component
MYKSKIGKGMCLVAALIFLLSSILTGCGGSNSVAVLTTGANSIKTESTLATTLKPALAPYNLKWYIGADQQSDMDAVQNEMNKQLKDTLNATITIIPTAFGSYNQKMQMLIASGEQFDLCFTANWVNNYYQNVNKGAFLTLDDLLAQNAPTINATLPKMGWDAARVKGKIYAIPNYQIWAMTNGLIVRKDLADKYQFDPKTVTKFEDVEPLLEQIKKGESGVTPTAFCKAWALWGTNLVATGFDEIAGRDMPGVVRLSDTTTKVMNQFETDEFKADLKLMRDWYQKGYIRKDAATVTDIAADEKAGKVALTSDGNYKPGGDIGAKTNFGGREVYYVPISKSVLLTSSIIATMTAVSRTSKDPERAIMFYDLLFKDKTLYNTLVLGIENKHYKTNADGAVEMIKNSGYDLSGYGWELGNQFNQKIMNGQPSTVWDDTIKINNSASASPILGFSFDPEPVKSELAKCSSIVQEYIPQLTTGTVDPDKVLPEFISKLKSAGSDKIITEEQKQIDQWKKDNGK